MVLEQFLTLSDGCCIFWRQLAGDGFDFLEIFGVEQSCISILVPHPVSTGSGGKGTSGQTSFQIMMREGAFTNILFVVEMRSFHGQIHRHNGGHGPDKLCEGVWGRRPSVPRPDFSMYAMASERSSFSRSASKLGHRNLRVC